MLYTWLYSTYWRKDKHKENLNTNWEMLTLAVELTFKINTRIHVLIYIRNILEFINIYINISYYIIYTVYLYLRAPLRGYESLKVIRMSRKRWRRVAPYFYTVWPVLCIIPHLARSSRNAACSHYADLSPPVSNTLPLFGWGHVVAVVSTDRDRALTLRANFNKPNNYIHTNLYLFKYKYKNKNNKKTST